MVLVLWTKKQKCLELYLQIYMIKSQSIIIEMICQSQKCDLMGIRKGQNIEQRYSLQFDDDMKFQVKQIQRGKHPPGIPPPYLFYMHEQNQQAHLFDPYHPSVTIMDIGQGELTQNHISINSPDRAFFINIRILFGKYQHRFLRDVTFHRLKMQLFDEYPDSEILQDRIQEVHHTIYKQMRLQGLNFKTMVKRKVHFEPQFKNIFEHYVHELFYLYQERSKKEVALLQNNLIEPNKPKKYLENILNYKKSSVSDISIQAEKQDEFSEISHLQISLNETFCLPAFPHNVSQRTLLFFPDNVSELELQSSDMQIEQYSNL